MSSFNDYLLRHSEHWLRCVIEEIERVNGIVPSIHSSLEERWDTVMRDVPNRARTIFVGAE